MARRLDLPDRSAGGPTDDRGLRLWGVFARRDRSGRNPTEAADRLVLEEDRLRRSLRNAWKRGPMHLLNTVLDVERGEELTLQDNLIRSAQQLEPAISPREEVMQGLSQ